MAHRTQLHPRRLWWHELPRSARLSDSRHVAWPNARAFAPQQALVNAVFTFYRFAQLCPLIGYLPAPRAAFGDAKLAQPAFTIPAYM